MPEEHGRPPGRQPYTHGPRDRAVWPPKAEGEDLPPSALEYAEPEPPRVFLRYEPKRRGRSRRFIVLPMLVAVIAAVVGYLVVRGTAGGKAPTAQMIKDADAGLSYALPPGWRSAGPTTLEPFTTSVLAPGNNAAMLVGAWEERRMQIPAPTSEAELKDATRELAEYLGGHAFPGKAESRPEPEWWDSGTAEVAKSPAYTAAYRLRLSGGDPVYVRVTTILLDRPVVVFAFVQPDVPASRSVIDKTVSGARPI